MRALLLIFYFFSELDFFYSSSLIAIIGTSRIMLSGPSCRVPDLRGNAFSFSPGRTMFSARSSYMAFIMLR